MEKVKERKSGIELLKIIAIFLIIISHTTQTLYQKPEYINEITKPLINLSVASLDIKHIILQIVSYFGSIGNTIFFICSAWFLCNKEESNKSKLIKMFLDVLIISILYLVAFLLSSEKLTLGLIAKSFLPNAYSNNWYISCYILFCLIYPMINKYIKSINQKEHAKLNIVFCSIYFIISFVIPGAYFSNNIIVFIVLFVLISYLNKYCIEYCNDTKANIIVAVIGALGLILIQVFSNYISLMIPSLSEKILLRWRSGNNPFLIIMVIGLFNIFNNLSINSRLINNISGCSMYIYLIHENILFRSLTRVRIEKALFDIYGFNHIFEIIFLFSLLLFAVSLVISIVYKNTISKVTSKASQKLSTTIENAIEKASVFVIEKIK